MIFLGRVHVACQRDFKLLAGEFENHEEALAAYTRALTHLYMIAAGMLGIPLNASMTKQQRRDATEEIRDALACPFCGERRFAIEIDTTAYPSIEALLEAVPAADPENKWPRMPSPGAPPPAIQIFRRPTPEKIRSN